MLTPADIEKKVFAVVRLREGYSSKEVDDFLDRVLVSYRELQAELDGYRRADTAVLPQVVPNEIIQASRLLELAEKAAKEQYEEAEVNAGALKDAARQPGQQIIQDAKAEATRLIEEGTNEKHAEVGRLEDQRGKMQTQINELLVVQQNVHKKLKAALEAIE